jgi:NAD(P)H-binding
MSGKSIRIFMAGATGVIGIRLLRLMLAQGHVVAAMTRTPGKIDELRRVGSSPILCDLFDSCSLSAAVKDFLPDVIVHQVTDLPDDLKRLPEFVSANNRTRSEGTRNLLTAAKLVNVSRFVAQSIAWPGGPVVDAHERTVVNAGGTVLRYGQFYGPGTYYEGDPPPAPRIHIDDAAHRTMSFLAGPPGIFTIADVDSDEGDRPTEPPVGS